MFKKQIRETLKKYGEKIMRSEEFKMAMKQKHHISTSVGLHSLHVAQASICLCNILKKAGIHLEERDVVIGALCHDLGMVGRYEKYSNNMECCHMHPINSVRITKNLVPDINKKTQDIIRTHMFPLTQRPPAYAEGVVVCLADKYVTLQDILAIVFKFRASKSGNC